MLWRLFINNYQAPSCHHLFPTWVNFLECQEPLSLLFDIFVLLWTPWFLTTMFVFPSFNDLLYHMCCSLIHFVFLIDFFSMHLSFCLLSTEPNYKLMKIVLWVFVLCGGGVWMISACTGAPSEFAALWATACLCYFSGHISLWLPN